MIGRNKPATMRIHQNENNRKRPLYYNIGLLVSCGLVLISFEWKTYSNLDVATDPDLFTYSVLEEDCIPITTQEEAEKPKVEERKPSPEMEVVDDTKEVADDAPEEKVTISLDDLPLIRDTRDENVADDFPRHSAEFEPVFLGGIAALRKFIEKELRYPELAKVRGIEGVVYVTFVIERDGSVSNVHVERGIPGGAMCDREAVRVISALPRFQPARQGIDTVRFYYMIPVSFKLMH